MSTYSISQAYTGTDFIYVDWYAENTGTFNVRVSIANESTGATILGSTVIAANGGYDNGTVISSGLSPSTGYTFVMSIRRASNYELLGTRTITASTNAAPPPAPPSWSSNFPSGQVGSGYSGSATATFPSGGSWGFLTAPSIPGLSLSYNGTTGFTLSGTPTSSGTYGFSARATDDFNQSTDASFSISISDPPPPPATVPNVVGQSQSTAVTSIQNAGLVASVSYTSSGANSGNNGTVASQSPTGGTSVSSGSTVFITIYSFNPPVWIDNVISNTFTVGTPYSDSVSATNSPTYSISSGSLPAGISLNSSSGAITGTPTTPQGYSFTIRAANGDGAVTVSYSGNTGSPPVWVDQTLGSFLQGRGYSDAVSATNSPTYTISAGSLPAGITLNSSTGAVTGTPSGSGSYSFTIQASNSSGSITASFSGSIVLVPNWIDNTLGTVINGVAFSDGVSATNSPSYSVTSGSLPAGLSLNSSTGAVTGTPTGSVGTAYSFTITATNAQGSVSQAFSGSVQPDLTGQVSVFDGSTWSPKEVYAYDGTAWNKGALHVYNGTSWVKSSF
jgi:large repetitive protein